MPGTVLSAILHNLIITTPFEAGTFFFLIISVLCMRKLKVKSSQVYTASKPLNWNALCFNCGRIHIM